MAKKIIFPTFNVSLGRAVEIVKTKLNDPDIAIKTKIIAIGLVADMETHNSVSKDELVNALRWLFEHYDFS